MAIASINPTPVPQTISESEQKSQNLSQSIKENLSKSVKYQIIDKILVAKEEDNKQNHLSQTQSQVTKHDSLTLSSTAKAITEEAFTFTDPSINRANSVQVSTQTIETGRARLSFSSEAIDQSEVKKSDPLAFDLDGNGIQTTGINQGIQFDINADGKTEQTSFISGNDAFLAYDKNGNGMIDNGSELFGDQNGASNGFEELKKYDDNNDGLIDKNDAIYSDLSLLSLDKNNQHKIASLTDQNIQSINLNYNNQHHAINYYDSVEQTSSFKRTDGTSGYAADILLGHK
jgi:hypothetical protein